MTSTQPISSDLLLSLPGRGVIVTGAASGMGRRTAELFAEAGAAVTATDISPIDPETEHGALHVSTGDVADEHYVRSLVEASVTTQRLAAVVHSAGIHDPTGLEATVDQWDRVIDVNLTSGFLLLKYAMPALVENGAGSVVLIGSTSGLDGGRLCGPAYAASKAGVHGLVKWAASRYARHGIRVNAIAPGPIDTPMNHLAGVDPAIVPLGHMGQPIDVARLALYLAADMGSYVTGQIWSVNGGTVI